MTDIKRKNELMNSNQSLAYDHVMAKVLKPPKNPPMVCFGGELPQADDVKYLGMHLVDLRLTWK